MKLLLVAAVALIDADGRVLIAQRPEGKQLAGLWEFPGGKVEAGERPEETLIRELHEELGIVVKDDGGLLFALALVVFLGSAAILFIRRAEFPVVGPRIARTTPATAAG